MSANPAEIMFCFGTMEATQFSIEGTNVVTTKKALNNGRCLSRKKKAK
jgi:hypothetical protein